MNKTISINIGGRNFFIEETAFAKLDGYLKAIRDHFSQYPGSSDIMEDMETRIAEKFSENSKNDPQTVITVKDIENLIAELGTVEDISGQEHGQSHRAEHKTQQESIAPKRLMRDGDDKVIAGVCSGLAAYFGTDPIVFRLAAGLLLLAGGSIIPIYLLLWLIMPEAKTPTEKMQMRGEAVNMDSLTETIKERAEEFKQHIKKHVPESKTTGAGAPPERERAKREKDGFLKELFGLIGKAARIFAVVILKIIGLGITIGTIVAIATITLAAASAIFNVHSPHFGFPLETIAHGAPYFVLVALAYVIIVIPLQFLALFGMAMFSQKSNLTPAKGFALLGIWLAALIAGGVMGLAYIPGYIEQVQNSQQMRTVSKTFDVKDFHDLKLGNSNSYRLVQGNTFSVKAKGLSGGVEKLGVTAENGTLTVGSAENAGLRFCIFCFNRSVEVEITAPDFNSVSASDSSRVYSDSITASSTSLTLTNSSRADIGYNTQNLTVSLTNSSQARLMGTADSLTARLKNSSRLYSEKLTVKNADIAATNSSRANVNAVESLKYSSSNSSRIFYSGQPRMEGTKGTFDGSEPLPFNPVSPDGLQ